MNDQVTDQFEEQELVTKKSINLETAKIAWKDLEVYFAGGNVIAVSPELDLTEIALQITEDNSEQLKDWMDKGMIDAVTDEQAKEYADTVASVWAVVIKPWILIQATKHGTAQSAAPQLNRYFYPLISYRIVE